MRILRCIYQTREPCKMKPFVIDDLQQRSLIKGTGMQSSSPNQIIHIPSARGYHFLTGEYNRESRAVIAIHRKIIGMIFAALSRDIPASKSTAPSVHHKKVTYMAQGSEDPNTKRPAERGQTSLGIAASFLPCVLPVIFFPHRFGTAEIHRARTECQVHADDGQHMRP